MRRIGLGLGCLLSAAAVFAAEPVAIATPAAAEARAEAPAPASAPSPDEKSAKSNLPLDLRIGDIREYMSVEDFQALSADRQPERNTVVVEARAELLEVKEDQPVPGGILAPFWALANPTQAWRIFLPDLKRPADEPPDSKIPPPVFRWGP